MKRACLTLLVMIFTIFLSSNTKASSTIKIDGNFSDWKDKSIFSDHNLKYSMVTQNDSIYIMVSSNRNIPLNYKLSFGRQSGCLIILRNLENTKGVHKVFYTLNSKKQTLNGGYLRKRGTKQQLEIKVPLNRVAPMRSISQISYIRLTILNRNRDSIANGDVSTLPQTLGF